MRTLSPALLCLSVAAQLAAQDPAAVAAPHEYRERGEICRGEADGSRRPLFVEGGHGHGDPQPPPPEPDPPPPPPAYRSNGGGAAPPPPPPAGRPAAGGKAPAAPMPLAKNGAHGVAVDSLETASWLDWWEWNRGVFELPQRANKIVVNGTATGQRAEAVSLLTRLSASPDAIVRAAAVQALGRTGAAPDQFTQHLDDGARAVRLAALLGLGSAGTAAHAHVLATRLAAPQQGETIAVALAGMAVVEAGPGQRALAATTKSLLADYRPSVQAAAALAAGSNDDDAMRRAARDALAAATTPAERAAALSLLGPHADADDVAKLTALANDRSVDVRRSASLALGRSRHALALPALQSAFENEHEMTTRALQLLAIGDHGGDAGRAFLLGELESGGKALRGFAALALGLWGHDRDAGDAAARVGAALQSERNRDQRGAYLLALGLLRDAASRDLLVRELRDGSTSPTRGAAAAALGLLGDRAALPALQQAAAADDCPHVREEVVRALGLLGTGATPALITVMKNDKDAGVQRAAAFALGGLTDGRAAAALLAFAADETVPAEARAGAALGLGRHFRAHEPRLPGLRFQQNHLLLPAITAWAFGQEL